MIALGWSQALDEGRATVVRDILAGSSIPVLLVPIGTRLEPDPADRPPTAAAAARKG
jgi:hypothetical protein